MEKEFMFEFDVVGTCTLTVEAQSIDEALETLKMGMFTQYLNEWSVDWPAYDDLKSHWSNRSEQRDNK